MRRTDTGGRGFTLVDVLLAMTLAGLLALGASAAVGRIGQGMRLRAATWAVTAGFHRARFQAILSGVPVRVRFAAPGLLCERYDEAAKAWPLLGIEPLAGVLVRANNAPVFHPQGTVTDLATVWISNARGTYRITVAITGRVKTVRTG